MQLKIIFLSCVTMKEGTCDGEYGDFKLGKKVMQFSVCNFNLIRRWISPVSVKDDFNSFFYIVLFLTVSMVWNWFIPNIAVLCVYIIASQNGVYRVTIVIRN